MILGKKLDAWMPAFVIIAKFGVSSAYMLVNPVTIELFPPLFSVTAFGFCNLAANLFCVIVPYLAEMPDPYPMLIFCTLATVASG